MYVWSWLHRWCTPRSYWLAVLLKWHIPLPVTLSLSSSRLTWSFLGAISHGSELLAPITHYNASNLAHRRKHLHPVVVSFNPLSGPLAHIPYLHWSVNKMYVCMCTYVCVCMYVYEFLLSLQAVLVLFQSCDICVVNLDHHCPFVNNCVGRGNRRVFVLFTLFASVVRRWPNLNCHSLSPW